MRIKIKHALLTPISNTKFTITLTIERKDKSFIMVEVTDNTQPKLSIFETLGDWWHSIDIDGELYDMNIYHFEEDKGRMTVVLYPLVVNPETGHQETDTKRFVKRTLKTH